MSEFYLLSLGLATKYLFAWVDTKSMGEAAVNWSYRDLARFHGSVKLKVAKGRIAGDLLGNETNLLVVSKKFIKILRESGVESFTTYEAQLLGKSGEVVHGYKGLGIVGRGGPNDPRSMKCPPGGTGIKRIDGLRPTAWDGSDLFTLDDIPRIALVTDRLKVMLENQKVTNCIFRPAEDFRI